MTRRKSITVDEDAFEDLARFKREEESWSDLVQRAADALESKDVAGDLEKLSTLSEGEINDIGAEVERRMQHVLETAGRR
jgi:predicted CopG family antitoxin